MPRNISNLIKPANRPARFLLWGAGGILALLLILFVAAFFIDEPLRRAMEANMNRALDGYSVRIREVDFNPIGFSVTVRDLVLAQEAHPAPPVATFPLIRASVHWREFFSGRIVSDWKFERPQLYVNLRQLQKESKDDVPVEKRGWQAAIEKIYPLKINLLDIRDGRFTYIDEDLERPLRLSRIYASANNIRNIRSPEELYPSPFRLEANILDGGHGVVEGNANFLAEPHVGLRASFDLRQIPLAKLGPVAQRANLHVNGGVLAGRGEFEIAPKTKRYHLRNLEVKGLKVDYVHSAETAAAEKRRAQKTKKAAEETAGRPDTAFQIDRLVVSGEAGMVNEAAEPKYRVFLSDAELVLTRVSDGFRTGPAEARLKGRFMGSGATAAFAVFRPREKGADLDLRLRIEGTRVPSMNDLLNAHGKFDVVSGIFSLYSEVRIRGEKIEGYIKPFFRDLDVYDPEQEKGEGFLKKIYEAVVGGVGQLLENPRERVATKADISGTLDNPEASTWQILVQLVRNGFFKAILPGFEQGAGNGE